MPSKLFIISLIIFSFFSTGEGKVKSQIEKSPCTEQMKRTFVGFYKQNLKKYNLLSRVEDFESEDCWFLEVKDKVTKTVMLMDVISHSLERKDQLVLSMFDPSRGWSFETNTQLDVMTDSYNALYLAEQNQALESPDRVELILQSMILPLIESVEPEEYSEILPFLRLSKMLGFEALIRSVYLNLADGLVRHNLGFYFSNFYEKLLNSFVQSASQMQSILDGKFGELVISSDTQNEIEHLVEHRPDELFSLFQNIVKNLEVLATKKGRFGNSELAKTANHKLNQVPGKKLIDFLNEYHRKTDRSKPRDWIHPSAQGNPQDKAVRKSLIAEMSQIRDFEFQFYMVELFALMGIQILRSTDKKAGMIEMVFSSSDKCLLSDFELDELVSTAVLHKWLLPSTPQTGTRALLRSCRKTVSGDLETFTLKLNPTGKSRCEIVIQRQDSDNQYADVDNRVIIILPDTNPAYTYGNSCLRDTTRQGLANVMNPGSYRRNLL